MGESGQGRVSVRSRFVGVALAALAATALAACGASGGSGNASGASGNTSKAASGGSGAHSAFVVGTAEPLSGIYASAGLDIVHALRAQAQIINARGGILGHKVKIVAVDTASNPQTAISATQQLISSHTLNMFEPDVIYGATQLPLVKNLLSINICAASQCGDGTKYPLDFTLNPPAADQVPPVVAYAKQHGDKKVGILATNDSQGTQFTAEATADAKAAGLTVSGSQSFSPTATDISAQVQSLKGSGAQAVFTWAAGATIATVMKGMQATGFKVPVLGTPTVFTAPVDQLVPTAVQSQLTCLCYAVGVRNASKPPSYLTPLVSRITPQGTIASMMVAGLAADSLSLADYGYTKAGSLNATKAAQAIQDAGSSSSFPASEFYAYRSGAPKFTASDHAPAAGPLARGFYGVAKVSPLVDGLYLGKSPFSF